jgi:hypothetical protein
MSFSRHAARLAAWLMGPMAATVGGCLAKNDVLS